MVRRSSLVVRVSFFVLRSSLFVVCCSLFVVRCVWSFEVCRCIAWLLFVVVVLNKCWFIVVGCLWLIVVLVFVVCWLFL